MSIRFLIIFILSSSVLFGQDCSSFLTVHRSGVKYPYKYDNQSKSGTFIPGSASELNIVCQEGKEYKLSFIVSSSILKYAEIKVTDDNGNVYYSYGDNSAQMAIKSKRDFLISLEDKKLSIKSSKQKKQVNLDIENLKLEISKMEEDAAKTSNQNLYISILPAETMNIKVEIKLGANAPAKGCVGVLVMNKMVEHLGF